jgi:Fe-S cluster biogenesis protein NfuA
LNSEIKSLILFPSTKKEINMTPEEQIRQKLDYIRTMLQADGGDLEIVEINNNTVKLRLKGACGGCPHAMLTIKNGIERILRNEVSNDIVVERVP